MNEIFNCQRRGHGRHLDGRVLVFGAALLLIAGSGAFAADIYTIDPVHSSIVFRVKHLGITFVFGRFNAIEGTYAISEKAAGERFIDIRARVDSIDTGNPKRDAHLLTPDFFDAKRHPLITFKSTTIEALDETSYIVHGDLSLHGVTRSMTIEAVNTGRTLDTAGHLRTGFETTFRIKRSRFGMKTMLGGVADTVELMISIEGIAMAPDVHAP